MKTSPFSCGPGLIRFCLAFVVVLHHSFPLRMGAWAVNLFFILSGYWIARMWQEKYRQARNPLLTFYVSRWWRLAPVFLFCSAVGLLSAIFLPIHWQPPPQPAVWLLGQIPIAGSSLAGRVLPPTWSLDVEMQFYLAAPFLVWAAGRVSGFLSGLALGGTCLLSGFYFLNGGSEEAAILWPFLPLFLCGVGIATFNWSPGGSLAFGSIAIFAAATIAIFALPGGLDGVWQKGAAVPAIDSSHAALYWVAAAFLCLPFIAWNVHRPSGEWDRWLGNLAYPLYMVHWIPRQAYYALVDWKASLFWNGFLLALNVATAVVAAVLILQFVDAPLDRLRARWVRSRLPVKRHRGN